MFGLLFDFAVTAWCIHYISFYTLCRHYSQLVLDVIPLWQPSSMYSNNNEASRVAFNYPNSSP